MFRRLAEKYLNIYLSLLVALTISLISFLGFFDHINGFIYDKTVSLTPNEKLQSKPILLIEISDEELSLTKQQWKTSLEKIVKFSPKSISFLHAPKESKYIFNNFNKTTPLFFAQELQLLYKEQDLYHLVNNEFSLDKSHIGYTTLPKSKDGIFRYYKDYFDTDFGLQPSLERRVVNHFVDGNEILGEYYINFNNSNTLPLMTLSTLLEENLVSEIIKEKHIVFGLKQRSLEVGLSTPIVDREISYLEFYGYSFLTLLNKNHIFNLYGIYEVITVLVFLFLGLLFHSLLRINFSPYSVVVALPLLYIFSFLSLNYLNIWIPITEIAVVVILVSYVIIWRRGQERKSKANNLLSNSADKMRERIMHKTFFNSDEYWDYISTLITQTLNLNKIIFLEKLENDHRLSEIKAVHCSFEDILEMRRDYEREPYKSAIEAREVIELSSRQFFKDIKENEEQYMAPLIYSGQVMGFWAFTMDKEFQKGIKNFKEILGQFSDEISTLLYQRSEWRTNSSKEKKPWLNLVAEDSDMVFRKIQGTFTMLDKRLNLLETVINRYDNAMVLYDMFGRVYHINKKMQDLLVSIDILPFKVSGEELLSNLCELESSKSTTVFRSAILEKESFLFEVKKEIEKGHSYLLKGVSISKEDLGENFNDTFLFDNYGILLEIIDISSYKGQVDLKRDVITEANRQIRDILQPLVTAHSLKTIDNDTLEIIHNKFNKFIFAYNKMEDLISQDIFFGNEQFYPISVTPYLKRAIKSLSKEAEEALIEIEITHQTKTGLAFVNPVNIQETLYWFIKFLIEDGTEESKVSIDIQESEKEIILIFGNQGFGIPNEKFQKLLFSKEASDELIYSKLHDSIDKIKKVGGKVVGFSQHGEGVIFMIYLKRYQ